MLINLSVVYFSFSFLLREFSSPNKTKTKATIRLELIASDTATFFFYLSFFFFGILSDTFVGIPHCAEVRALLSH